ncbi:MAG: non-canonical purine NTP pyrophosphatase [Candidatus Micrarchaeota archaeon]
MKTVLFVTTRKLKFKIAQKHLAQFGIRLKQVRLETPEIQDWNVRTIAAYSAKWAANRLKKPVLVQDSGLEICALNGFPGPFAKYAEQTLGTKGILKLLKGVKNRKAVWTDAIAYCKPNGKSQVIYQEDKARIALKPSGKFGREWDKIFIMDGQTKTLASVPEFQAILTWKPERYEKIAKIILKGKKGH